MKKSYGTILHIFLLLFLTEKLSAQIVNIPDPKFKNALLTHSPVINTNGDGEIQVSEAQVFNGTLTVSNKYIVDLTGIEAFTAMTKLDCMNNQITSLDLTANTALKTLFSDHNLIASLNVTGNSALTFLGCSFNKLTSLDVSTNLSLKTLTVSNNFLTSIDISVNTNLANLGCGYNQLTTINTTTNTALTQLSCGGNLLTSLDVSANTVLDALYCSENQLTSLDVSINTALITLNCAYNQLVSLDLTTNQSLFNLYCNDNFLTILDLAWNTVLSRLDCYNNRIAMLNLNNNRTLKVLQCYNNQLTALNLKENTALQVLWAFDNKLTSLDLSANSALIKLNCDNNQLSFLDMRNGNNSAVTNVYMYARNNPNLTCISVDNPIWSATNWSNRDAQIQFSSGCSCGIFSINLDEVRNVACADSGYARASVSGASGPFQYEWLNAPLSSDSILITDTAGIFTLKLKDINQCESFRKLILKEPKVKTGFELNSNLDAEDFRPGRATAVALSAWNDGCVIENARLSLTYNGPLIFESSTILPTSQTGGGLMWDLVNMQYSISDFLSTLKFRVSTLAQAGDRVCFQVSMTPLTGDADSTNNLKSYCYSVINSYDPNDKQVYPQGVCAENYTLKNQTLTYTIRFQNTGNAPAIDVYLIDSLSPYLDIHSLRVLEASHAGLLTEVLGDDILKFNFENINLADSLSDEAGSKGFVIYELSPYPGLNDGTIIENSAGIYFDFNPPVITNTTKNTLVSVLPQIAASTITETACGTYTAPNHAVYTSSGTYTAVVRNTSGCDSIITINLTVKNPSSSTISETVCNSYTAPNGIIYSTSGTFTAVIPNASGCDSTITINLTVNNSSTSNITESVCGSYTAPDGQIYTTSGTYTAVIPNASGCDSIITINLTVNNPSTSSISENVCSSYTAPDGQVYTASGTYTALIPNTAGCDSTITINLTLLQASNSISDVSTCGSYTAPDGQVLTTSGNYTVTIPNAMGCDSIITINLNLSELQIDVPTLFEPYVVAIPAADSYHWYDCSNGALISTDSSSHNLEFWANLMVIVDYGSCSDTISCNFYNPEGIEEYLKEKVKLYPNPTDGLFHVDLGQIYSKVTINITDIQGRTIIREEAVNQQHFELELNETAGVYLVHVLSDGRELSVIRLIKN